MSYRDDVAALDARVESLRRDAVAKVNELERAEQLASDARRLVRSRAIGCECAPCTASWNDMKGDARVRYCAHCRKNVYNFTELTRDEIDELVVKYEGKLCARFFLRADGTIKTKDCQSDIRMRPHRVLATLGAAAVAASAVVASCSTMVDAHRPQPQTRVEMTEATPIVDEIPEDPPDEPFRSSMAFEATAMGGISMTPVTHPTVVTK